MKEYLIKDPQTGYYWASKNKDHGFVCEIPSGADTYLELNKRNLAFYKDNFKYCYLNESEGWVKTDGCSEAFTHFKALWKRQSMVKPKEYLFKGIDGTYKVVDHDCQGRAIEIPFGATIAIHLNKNNQVYFWKNVDHHFMEGRWVSCEKSGILNQDDFLNNHEGDCIIVWKQYNQPEELPFVDDGSIPKQDYGSPLIRPFISVDDVPMTEDDFKKQLSDNVNNPQHYTSGTIECIDAIESSMTGESFAGFLKGNVQKYMWRYENKGGVESLQKAQWYLNRLILLQSAHD